jgi:GDP-mannose 6-dehydrogenase
MNILVFGLGYVGLTGVACALKANHTVFGVDTAADKVEAVRAGHCPIVEPGIPEMIAQGARDGRLDAGVTFADRIADADLAIVCVGTPSLPDGSHNMSYIANVSRQIADALAEVDRGGRALSVVFRSTMRPGSIEDLIWPIFVKRLGKDDAERKVELVYNPEFLRESTAVKDYFSPPKIVVGTKDGKPCEALDELFEGIEAPRFYCRYRDSEFVKFMDNAFHATKVAFANEAGRVAAAYGVSAAVTHEIFVADTKLNVSPYYLRPGGAVGG